MKNTESILSHLVLRFKQPAENLATEALLFILEKSSVARQALIDFSRQFGYGGSSDIRYRSQAANEEGTRPDLIGMSPAGAVELILEAKFWAGLTDAQPVGYLNSFVAQGGLLLFVAPALRLDALWPELSRRVEASTHQCGPSDMKGSLGRARGIGKNHLGLTSWRALLAALLAAVEAEREESCAEDIRQLIALCERMDSDAFLPLHSDDLSQGVGRRFMQFARLADSLTNRLVSLALAQEPGGVNLGRGFHGHYVKVKGCPAFVEFSALNWDRWGDSPLWFAIRDPHANMSSAISAALDGAGIQYRVGDLWFHIPILLPTGADEDTVLESACQQVSAVWKVLPPCETTQ